MSYEQGDALRILARIKQVEIYLSRLKAALEQAKKENAPDQFSIHSLMATARADGAALVEQYNSIARLQKENQQYLVAAAKQAERTAIKTLRIQLNHSIHQRLNQPKQEE